MLTSISASLPNSRNNLGLFTGPCFRTVLLPTSFTTTLSENSTTKRCGDENFLGFLSNGVEVLSRQTASPWSALSPEARLQALRSAEETPFFQRLRSEFVLYFYSNPAIWPLFGYEGPSNDKARLSPSRLQRHRLDQERGLKFLCRKDLICMMAA